MKAALYYKPHEMIKKNFICRGLQCPSEQNYSLRYWFHTRKRHWHETGFAADDPRWIL